MEKEKKNTKKGATIKKNTTKKIASKKNDKDYETLKKDFILILIFSIIAIFGTIILYSQKILLIIANIIVFILSLIGISKANNKDKSTKTIGIIMSIILICTFSILDIVFGIFMLIHSLKLKK